MTDKDQTENPHYRKLGFDESARSSLRGNENLRTRHKRSFGQKPFGIPPPKDRKPTKGREELEAYSQGLERAIRSKNRKVLGQIIVYIIAAVVILIISLLV